MLAVLLLLLVVVASVLAAVVAGQRRRIRVLEAELRRADDDVAERADMITIHIRNHAELAASRSPFAKPLGRFTPGLLRSIVHRETVRQMRSQMAEQGVDADVHLRRLVARRSRESQEDPRNPDPATDADVDVGLDGGLDATVDED